MLDPTLFLPSTHFLFIIKISFITGKAIASEIISYLTNKDISMDKGSGFGTDGANVLTGEKEGATGQFMRNKN